MLKDVIESWWGLSILAAVFIAGMVGAYHHDKRADGQRRFAAGNARWGWFMLWFVGACLWWWFYYDVHSGAAGE